MTIVDILFYILIIYVIFLKITITIRLLIRTMLRNLLIKTVPILNDNNIEYWIDFGTLLGLHRDKDIIIGDTDCDICIWKKDEDKIRPILQSFAKSNRNITFREYDWGAFRIILWFFYIDIYKADIDESTKMVIIPSSFTTPLYLLDTFETLELPIHNTTIKIRQPTKWEKLLEFRYTENWKKRLHKWWLGYFSLHNTKLCSE